MKASSTPFHLCFETLSNPLRISIIKSLEKKSKTVKSLCLELKSEQSTISHSLSVLRECNFVESKVLGKERLYSLSESFLADLPRAKDIFSVLEKHFEKKCKGCYKKVK